MQGEWKKICSAPEISKQISDEIIQMFTRFMNARLLPTVPDSVHLTTTEMCQIVSSVWDLQATNLPKLKVISKQIFPNIVRKKNGTLSGRVLNYHYHVPLLFSCQNRYCKGAFSTLVKNLQEQKLVKPYPVSAKSEKERKAVMLPQLIAFFNLTKDDLKETVDKDDARRIMRGFYTWLDKKRWHKMQSEGHTFIPSDSELDQSDVEEKHSPIRRIAAPEIKEELSMEPQDIKVIAQPRKRKEPERKEAIMPLKKLVPKPPLGGSQPSLKAFLAESFSDCKESKNIHNRAQLLEKLKEIIGSGLFVHPRHICDVETLPYQMLCDIAAELLGNSLFHSESKFIISSPSKEAKITIPDPSKWTRFAWAQTLAFLHNFGKNGLYFETIDKIADIINAKLGKLGYSKNLVAIENNPVEYFAYIFEVKIYPLPADADTKNIENQLKGLLEYLKIEKPECETKTSSQIIKRPRILPASLPVPTPPPVVAPLPASIPTTISSNITRSLSECSDTFKLNAPKNLDLKMREVTDVLAKEIAKTMLFWLERTDRRGQTHEEPIMMQTIKPIFDEKRLPKTPLLFLEGFVDSGENASATQARIIIRSAKKDFKDNYYPYIFPDNFCQRKLPNKLYVLRAVVGFPL